MTYLTRAIRVSELPDRVVIERERRILVDREPGPGAATGAPSDADLIERDIVELDRVSAAQLEGEAREAGLRPEPTQGARPPTITCGSVVVMSSCLSQRPGGDPRAGADTSCACAPCIRT